MVAKSHHVSSVAKLTRFGIPENHWRFHKTAFTFIFTNLQKRVFILNMNHKLKIQDFGKNSFYRSSYSSTKGILEGIVLVGRLLLYSLLILCLNRLQDTSLTKKTIHLFATVHYSQ